MPGKLLTAMPTGHSAGLGAQSETAFSWNSTGFPTTQIFIPCRNFNFYVKILHHFETPTIWSEILHKLCARFLLLWGIVLLQLHLCLKHVSDITAHIGLKRSKLTALSLEQLCLSPVVNLLGLSPVWGALCGIRTLCGFLVCIVLHSCIIRRSHFSWCWLDLNGNPDATRCFGRNTLISLQSQVHFLFPFSFSR